MRPSPLLLLLLGPMLKLPRLMGKNVFSVECVLCRMCSL
jgi:hypothetical protein